MDLGVPVVARNIAVHSSIIEDKGNGLLYTCHEVRPQVSIHTLGCCMTFWIIFFLTLLLVHSINQRIFLETRESETVERRVHAALTLTRVRTWTRVPEFNRMKLDVWHLRVCDLDLSGSSGTWLVSYGLVIWFILKLVILNVLYTLHTSSKWIRSYSSGSQPLVREYPRGYANSICVTFHSGPWCSKYRMDPGAIGLRHCPIHLICYSSDSTFEPLMQIQGCNGGNCTTDLDFNTDQLFTQNKISWTYTARSGLIKFVVTENKYKVVLWPLHELKLSTHSVLALTLQYEGSAAVVLFNICV